MECKNFCITVVFFCLIVCSFGQKPQTENWLEPPIVNIDEQDESSWNVKFLKNDIQYFYENEGEESFPQRLFPLGVLPFPVVDYGFGASGAGEFMMDTPFQLSVSYFLVGKHDYNQSEFGPGETHLSFCNIVILSDTLDQEEYQLIQNYVTSRNHPDYVGEGSVYLKNRQIDYVCFHRPDHTSYAVIGTKLFDLQLGQTIIVAPYSDGSVRFLQLKTPRLNHRELMPYLKKLVQEKPVFSFLKEASALSMK